MVAIHQPEHLVWLGLIDKISQADLFVILDTVQYRKNYYQNRNRIRTVDEWTWVTVPVQRQSLHTNIEDICISTTREWIVRYLSLLELHYRKSKYFAYYYSCIEEMIRKNHKFLSDLNMELITFLLEKFGVTTPIIRASELSLSQTKRGTDLLLKICEKTSADVYLSGVSGKDYLDISRFENAGIQLVYQRFYHPIYEQSSQPFIPAMSSLDLLFHYGQKARQILWGEEVERLDHIIEG